MKQNKFKKMAKRIRQMNDWRRGDGKYFQDGDNYVPIPAPESSKDWGELLDEVAGILEKLEQQTSEKTKGKNENQTFT